MKGRLPYLLLSTAVALVACTPEPAPKQPTPSTQKKTATTVSFEKDIRPILSNKCTICHNTQVLPKRPNFEVGEKALRSGVIVPGNPDASRILTVVLEDEGKHMAMPPVSHRLSSREIALFRTWIREGAHWPSGPAGRVKPAFIPEE